MVELDLSSYSDAPVYNTKAVVQRTGIPAATLRAWERRYGVPAPERTESNYRLYSERDIALIEWLRRRVDEGITTSQAVELYKRIESGGDAPTALLPETGIKVQPDQPLSFATIHERLIEAFRSFDENGAEAALSEAFAVHPLERVCTNVISPVLETMGELWHQGTISVPVEHFATAFIERKLISLVNVQPFVPNARVVVAGCATHEQHRIGILLLSLFLRRAGYRVIYLGADIPVRDLQNVLERFSPTIIALSAATTAALPSLREFGTMIEEASQPHPLFLVGGRLLTQEPDLATTIPNAHVLDQSDDIEEMVRDVIDVIGQHGL